MDIIDTLNEKQKKAFNQYISENTKVKGNVALHHKSFQAKEFRLLSSILPFALADVGASEEWILLMCKVAEFCFWTSRKIITHDQFIHLYKLTQLIVTNCCFLSPTCAGRSKTHMLLHLMESIQNFGMPYNYDVETFESLNKISRFAIQHSNNRNDALAAVEHWIKKDTIEHVLNGGLWFKNEKEVHTPGIMLNTHVASLFEEDEKEFEDYIEELDFCFDANQGYLRLVSKERKKFQQVGSELDQFGLTKLTLLETFVSTTDDLRTFKKLNIVMINDTFYDNIFN
jgi:hypothetical protein